MTHPLAADVSVFHGSTNVRPAETVPFWDVLQRIKDGTYRQFVEGLRQIRTTQSPKAYAQAKTQSMAFTPAGVFVKRAKAQLTTPSRLVHFDFDHFADLPDAKARLSADPWVVYAFVSPGGDGLKVAVWADGIVDDATYRHAWQTVAEYFARTYADLAVANDSHCKDVSRLCYVSWDPDLYSNPDALLYVVPPSPAPAPKRRPPRTTRPQAAGEGEQARVEDALQVIPADDYDTWLRVGMALHASGEAWARAVWDTWSQRSDKYDTTMQQQKWASFAADGGVNLATVFHMNS